MLTNLLTQVDALMQANDWSQASSLLEQARQSDSHNIDVLYKLGFCYSQAQRYADAIEVYQILCSLQPQEAKWFYLLGYQHYAQLQYDQAIIFFDKALKIRPDYIAVLYRKGYALSRLPNSRGKALTVFEQCRKAFNSLSDGDRKDLELKHYAKACLQQGKLFCVAGNYELAEKRLLEAEQMIKDDADLHYNLGKLYVETQRFVLALEALKVAQRLAGKPVHYILDYMGRAYQGLGDYNAALQVYKSMPEAIQNRPYILRNMGEVYINLAQWGPAEAVLKEAVRVDRRNHNGHYHLGMVYEKLGRISEAIREYQCAIDLRKGTYNKAFPEAEKALNALKVVYSGIAAPQRVTFPVPAVPGRLVGKVINFVEAKGYGFLEVPGREKGLFFHITEVKGLDTVNIGGFFEFSLREGRKGPEAYDLQLIVNTES